MPNAVRTNDLTPEVIGKLTEIVKCLRQNGVISANLAEEIGQAGVQRLEKLRDLLIQGLDGIEKADVTMVSNVDTLHVAALIRYAKDILLPDADSLSLSLCEKIASGRSTLFLANVKKFVPLSPEENKYLIIESNMLGSDVRNIFVGSLLLLIK